MNALRAIYRYWLTILWLAVVAQIAAAAYGAFYAAQKLGDQKGADEHKLISEKTFDHGFGFHTGSMPTTPCKRPSISAWWPQE